MCENCIEAWDKYNAVALKLRAEEKTASENSKTWDELLGIRAARREAMKSVDEFLFRVKANCAGRGSG